MAVGIANAAAKATLAMTNGFLEMFMGFLCCEEGVERPIDPDGAGRTSADNLQLARGSCPPVKRRHPKT
jgi:hypothetical protein